MQPAQISQRRRLVNADKPPEFLRNGRLPARVRPVRLHGLYAIADPTLRPDLPLPTLCERLARAGVSVVQIRWKAATSRELFEAAKAAAPLVRAAGASLVVNDRPDVALLAGADGVHMGADDLPVAAVREWVGDKLAIGATVRDLVGAVAAWKAGADYVGFGPVFATGTKVVDAAPRGLEGLRSMAAGAPLPVVAIAGISQQNIAAVAACGPVAAAMCSELLMAPDLEAKVNELLAAFEAGARR